MYGSRGGVAFGWGENKAAAANKKPIKQNANRTGKRVGRQVGKQVRRQGSSGRQNADHSRQAGRQEKRKERKTERTGCAHIHDEVTTPGKINMESEN